MRFPMDTDRGFVTVRGPLLSGSCGMQVCSKISVLTQHNNGERTGANLDEVMLDSIECEREAVWDAVSEDG